MFKITYIRPIFFTGIALTALFFLFKEVNIRQLTANFRIIDWRFSILAFLCYSGVNMLRAFRFQLFIDQPIGVGKLMRVIFLQNFFNTILPFKLGDLSYVRMVHRFGKINVARNITSLAASRILDFLSAILIFSGSLFVYRELSTEVSNISLIVAFFLLILILFLVLLFKSANLIGLVDHLFSKTWLKRWKFSGRLHDEFSQILLAFSDLGKHPVLVKGVFYSVSLWLINFFIGWLLLKSVLIPLEVGHAFVAYGFPILITMIPWYVSGNLGFYEGSSTFGLLIVGVAKQTAIVASFLIHFQEIFFVFALAGLAYLAPFLVSGWRLINYGKRLE